MSDELIEDFIKNLQVANAKGYMFECSNSPNKCEECGAKLVNMVSNDLDEVAEHSYRNNVAFWVINKTVKRTPPKKIGKIEDRIISKTKDVRE